MNPLELIPSPDAVPVHWGWFRVFLIGGFVIHILLVNALLGGGFLAMIAGSSRFDGEGLGKNLSGKLPVIFAFAINFGVAPLLFLQVLYGSVWYVSSQLMAVYMLSIICLLLIAYGCAYLYKFRFEALGESRKFIIGASVAVLFVIGLIISNNMTLMLDPSSWGRYFDAPNGLLLNLSDPTLAPRYLHFVTASIAVGGLLTALIHARKSAFSQAGINWGMKWFTAATIFQTAVGFWFLMSLPGEIFRLFSGGNSFYTGLFMVNLFLSVAVLFFGFTRKPFAALPTLIMLVTGMCLMRDLVRTQRLEPWFRISDLTVTGEYGTLFIFLGVLVTVSAVIARVFRMAGSSDYSVGA